MWFDCSDLKKRTAIQFKSGWARLDGLEILTALHVLGLPRKFTCPASGLPHSVAERTDVLLLDTIRRLSSSPGRKFFEDTQRFNWSSNYSSVFFFPSFSFFRVNVFWLLLSSLSHPQGVNTVAALFPCKASRWVRQRCAASVIYVSAVIGFSSTVTQP